MWARNDPFLSIIALLSTGGSLNPCTHQQTQLIFNHFNHHFKETLADSWKGLLYTLGAFLARIKQCEII